MTQIKRGNAVVLCDTVTQFSFIGAGPLHGICAQVA